MTLIEPVEFEEGDRLTFRSFDLFIRLCASVKGWVADRVSGFDVEFKFAGGPFTDQFPLAAWHGNISGQLPNQLDVIDCTY